MEHASLGINRRTVVKALGSAPFATLPFGAVAAPESSDVIVITANFLGLSKALSLESNGYKVTVLEGSRTVGSFSDKFNRAANANPDAASVTSSSIQRRIEAQADALRRMGVEPLFFGTAGENSSHALNVKNNDRSLCENMANRFCGDIRVGANVINIRQLSGKILVTIADGRIYSASQVFSGVG